MEDVALENALLLWDSGLNGGNPAFAVRPLGHPDYDQYDFQNGACFRTWREMTCQGRRLKFMVELWHIVAFYAVPIDLMRPALLVIPEYRDMLADDCLPKQFQAERF